MNTKKHKNKNKQKPANTTLPEKQSAETEVIKNVEILEEKIDLKPKTDDVIKVESVSSETADTNISVVTQKDFFRVETPKKPKRNRGKKIKEADKQDSSTPAESVELSLEDPKLSGEIKVVSDVVAEIVLEENVVPTLRKKKNKNKKLEAQDTKAKEDAVSIIKPDTNEEIEIPQVEKDSVVINPTENDNKQSKRKNKKKKNRNDSEKSDKPDESVLCTAAFQKLLENPVQAVKSEIVDQHTSLLIDDSSTSEATVKEISITVDKTPSSDQLPDQNLKDETMCKGNKQKKKNKKDKNVPKDAESKSEPPVEETTLPELCLVNKLETNADKETLSTTNPLPVPEKAECLEKEKPIAEKSLKASAKIAKPVEKKAKRNKSDDIAVQAKSPNHDIHNIDKLTDVNTIESNSIILIEPIKSDDDIIKAETKDSIVEIITSSHEDKQNSQPLMDTSKSSSVSEILISKEPVLVDVQSKIECETILKCDLSTEINIDQGKVPLECTEKKGNVISENLTMLTTDETTTRPTELISITCEQEPKINPVCADLTSSNETEDFKVTKNRKKNKSPKPQKQADVSRVESKAKPDNLAKSDNSGHLQLTDFNKTETSASETTPDLIECPRSTSQEPFDDNNNKCIIQEVNTAEIKDSPITFPVIQGSGETPTPSKDTPFQLKDSVNIDLKSKMLEVNKSMEDIRKSIERTIAGLAGIESIEMEEDKRFEQPQQSTCLTSDKNIQGEFISKKENLGVIEENKSEIGTTSEAIHVSTPEPPSRKDNKGKGKSKKKGKQDSGNTSQTSQNIATVSETKVATETKQSSSSQEEQKSSEGKEKSKDDQQKGKQQSTYSEGDSETQKQKDENLNNFSFIENFEDALTSSVEDVNKTFEMISNDTKNELVITEETQNSEIDLNIDKKHTDVKENPLSQPKNLLGQPDIPVSSNKTDYKKEKNKITPNMRQAKVKIRDSEAIETSKSKKQSKECQTVNKPKVLNGDLITEASIKDGDDEYVYKYSFRKVFLPSACHVCKKDLKQLRVICTYCNLVFYCSPRHKDEDWPQHQALCFAVNTIAHLKGQKHIYSDAKNVSGQNYRLLRMQTILSCEKVLKRKLVPYEQEVLLYPRMCADASCREWRQNKLKDCDGCGQIFYCASDPTHLPATHHRWCKSYSLYGKLVCFQQTTGRLEPQLPTKVMKQRYVIPEKMNEVLASMYEEKIDMSDLQYASLTQVATAPLTAAYCHQLCTTIQPDKKTFTIHIVGAELQFEADSLKKWETFFLHLRPDVEDLRIVMVGQQLNPSQLPLDLLGKIKVCTECSDRGRRLTFDFHDVSYQLYCGGDDFTYPDIVCAFNASIQRSAIYNGKDTWPSTINSILKLKIPFLVTSYTLQELVRDITRVKEITELEFKSITDPKMNVFASVRPDRNFISDDEMPLLFKNYCYSVVCGV